MRCATCKIGVLYTLGPPLQAAVQTGKGGCGRRAHAPAGGACCCMRLCCGMRLRWWGGPVMAGRAPCGSTAIGACRFVRQSAGRECRPSQAAAPCLVVFAFSSCDRGGRRGRWAPGGGGAKR
ncbi:MAG: hypothetical protein J3K34DRAFT_405207 [Monoraphidium minutum]|nr:MAG: hypothetical protein J3K34DRAFT_405207 [Monoraphidium minutum]